MDFNESNVNADGDSDMCDSSTGSESDDDAGVEVVDAQGVSVSGGPNETGHMSLRPAHDTFPTDATIALFPPHADMDAGLFQRVLCCKPSEELTSKEMNFSDTDVLMLSTKSCRALCKKCGHIEGSSNKQKNVSMSGKVADMKKRLLAWCHLFHQEKAGGNQREFSFSSNWTAAEDARLLETMSDPGNQDEPQHIHQRAPRPVIDAVSGVSPVASVWKVVVSVKHNNFQHCRPTLRFPDDALLKRFDANADGTPCRAPEQLKNRHAKLRSCSTVQHNRCKNHSGRNEPGMFSEHLDLENSSDDQSVCCWHKVCEVLGDVTTLDRHLKLVPDGLGTDTSDPSAVERSLAAADAIGGGRRSRRPLTSSSVNNEGDGRGGRGRGGGSKGSSTDKIVAAIGKLEQSVKSLEDKENQHFENADTKPLMENRDRAETEKEQLAEKVRSFEQGSNKFVHTRKRHKRAFDECVQLERQVADALGMPFDEEIAEDDASFFSHSSQEMVHCDAVDCQFPGDPVGTRAEAEHEDRWIDNQKWSSNMCSNFHKCGRCPHTHCAKHMEEGDPSSITCGHIDCFDGPFLCDQLLETVAFRSSN